MRTGANILWFILGGWITALAWLLAACIMAITIIGLPWTRACWEIGLLNLMPFGRDIVSVADLRGGATIGQKAFGLIANIIWLPLGIILAIVHAIHGLVLFCTIIGIPFGIQAFKLAGISLFPVGKRVVFNEVAVSLRQGKAEAYIQAHRR